MNHETETIDKLFLELSQFTQAKTRRELDLEATLHEVRKQLMESESSDEAACVTYVRCVNIINSVLSQ